MTDHVLRPSREEYRGNYLLRVCPCECREDCDVLVLMISQTTLRGLRGASLPLWLCVGLADTRTEEEAVGMILQDANQSILVHKALIVHGALWEKAGRRAAAVEQARAWALSPDWRGVPDELLLGVRAVCYGDDFTRTARALTALDESYDPGGVVLCPREEAPLRVAASKRLDPWWDPKGNWS